MPFMELRFDGHEPIFNILLGKYDLEIFRQTKSTAVCLFHQYIIIWYARKHPNLS